MLGSIHCIAMCGPIAGYGCTTLLNRKAWGGPLLFVSGKLISYALVGLLAGSVGGWLLSFPWVPKAGAWLAIISGGLMISLIGFHWLVPAKSTVHWSLRLLKPIIRTNPKANDSKSQQFRIPFLLGFCAALLPCGLLHAMVLRAAATGSPSYAMGMMVAFGIGTSPALVGIAGASLALPVLFRKNANRIGEGFVVALAIVMIFRGINGLSMPDACILCK